MPSPEQTRKIKTRFEKMSVPFYIVKEDDSRGAKHARERWQYDHWKAKDATKAVLKRNYCSFWHRLHTDKRYQESQWNHGWTREYCRYLDYLATVDITYIATWPKRSRERCQIEMIFNLQPVHLLFSDTRKGKPPVLRSRNEKGKYHSMKSCDPNLNGRVGIVGKFMDRRYHLHLRQPGGNHMNGKIHKNDMNGKDSKSGMDGENGNNKYSIFDSSFYIMNLLKVRGPSVIFCCETLAHS